MPTLLKMQSVWMKETWKRPSGRGAEIDCRLILQNSELTHKQPRAVVGTVFLSWQSVCLST